MLDISKHRVACPCGGAYYMIGSRTLEKHQLTFIHRFYINNGRPYNEPAKCLID